LAGKRSLLPVGLPKKPPLRKARQNIFLAGFKPKAKKHQLKNLEGISYD
jgi:hypothetical protein